MEEIHAEETSPQSDSLPLPSKTKPKQKKKSKAHKIIYLHLIRFCRTILSILFPIFFSKWIGCYSICNFWLSLFERNSDKRSKEMNNSCHCKTVEKRTPSSHDDSMKNIDSDSEEEADSSNYQYDGDKCRDSKVVTASEPSSNATPTQSATYSALVSHIKATDNNTNTAVEQISVQMELDVTLPDKSGTLEVHIDMAEITQRSGKLVPSHEIHQPKVKPPAEELPSL